jgi:hypothetical protein
VRSWNRSAGSRKTTDGLAGVREINALCAGDPAGPSLYPAATVFPGDVVRGPGEQRENFLEYFSLQGWLISLDGHKVVPSGFSADVSRGFPLGVRGVEGDQD